MARDVIDLPIQGRAAAVQSVDEEARTVQVVWTTGAQVRRYNWAREEEFDEELVVDPSAMRLGRLNGGAPFLESHRSWGLSSVLGVVVEGSVRIEGGKGYATVRMSEREEVEPVWRDIRTGIIRNVSVGYQVHRFERVAKGDRTDGGKRALYRAVDWEPMEISAVAIGADPGAGFRDAETRSNPCVVIRHDASQQEEATMADETQTAAGGVTEAARGEVREAHAVTTPAPTGADIEAAARAAVEAERQRAAEIRNLCRKHRLGEEFTEGLIGRGVTLEAARVEILDALAARDPFDGRGTVPAEVAGSRRDASETQVEGMIGALMGRSDGPAEAYRGLRLKRLALELCGRRNVFNEAAAVRDGMRSTYLRAGAQGVSDFAYITTEVMNRTLMDQYQRNAATWTAVAGTPLSAADFRELHAVRFGGDFALRPVTENGEYQMAVLDDEAEGLRVERRGRTIRLTFEAVINDDMGAFARIPSEFAIAARTMENAMVWGLIRNNAVMKSDNQPIFHTSHNNTVAVAAIDATSVGAARKRMWEQRAFGTKDTDDFLDLTPDRLIVPPALELTAMQFTAVTVPTSDTNTNPFKATLNPITVPNLGAAAGGHDNRWYLVSSRRPPISVAYLAGYEAPTIQTVEGMNPDVVTMDARHIFGAAPHEWRGIQRIGQ